MVWYFFKLNLKVKYCLIHNYCYDNIHHPYITYMNILVIKDFNLIIQGLQVF